MNALTRRLSARDVTFVINLYAKKSKGVHFRVLGGRRWTILWERDGAIPDQIAPMPARTPKISPKWRERADRAMKAAAWDEGYRYACREHGNYASCRTGDHGQRHANPYREAP